MLLFISVQCMKERGGCNLSSAVIIWKHNSLESLRKVWERKEVCLFVVSYCAILDDDMRIIVVTCDEVECCHHNVFLWQIPVWNIWQYIHIVWTGFWWTLLLLLLLLYWGDDGILGRQPVDPAWSFIKDFWPYTGNRGVHLDMWLRASSHAALYIVIMC